MKKNKNKETKSIEKAIALIVLIIVVVIGTYFGIEFDVEGMFNEMISDVPEISYSIEEIPEYNGKIYVVIDDNNPDFSEEDMEINEYYSELKDGRVGMCIIKTSWKKAKSDEVKDDYSSIYPTGYKQKKYDSSIVPGEYIYNRSHIIGWMLGGKDVDERNLMAGTQNFNMNGMKQFEDKVYDYLRENKSNHVLYRVTPYFVENNKLANGVQMEAYSIEDNGKLHFNVYVYNVQDGIIIDYATGENKLAKK
ncbi:MAG: DNA/RNA non-specific endonuclease [Clostridia bacterium]|nr:DNA/RNA non-specific endonuclease [Clostridia bacterium]